jgi:DNA-binding FadR family transcriptional regulator
MGDRTTVLSYDAVSTEFFETDVHHGKPERHPTPPRKRRSLAQELVTVLSEQIRDGHLKRGDKLPTESAIMDAHGVSRTVVREAISRLQAAGQVETRHGIGTFVLDTPSPSGFRIDPATVVTLRDVLAILELRISLEVESAGLAAQRRAPSSWRHARGPGCAE